MTSFAIGRPRFVTNEEAMAFHALVIEAHGGSLGVRDQGMLDSSLAMPRQGFSGEYAHTYPFEMAAAYAFHVAMNHPFVDGNKRVALACCVAFLRMNGWNLESEGEAAADAVLALVDGSMDKASFAAWLAANCRERPRLELRDFFAALNYQQLAEHSHGFAAGSHQERVVSILEAATVIPAIHAANIGLQKASAEGKNEIAATLLAHSSLLTAIYRVAEDMGYEW